MRVCVTVVFCVGLVEALGVDEAESIQARIHGSGAVGLIRHQGVVAIAHPAVHLQTQKGNSCGRQGGFL